MPSSDHIRIGDNGELELAAAPTTWDGEPLFSPSTVAEGLFDTSPFHQMRGQIALEAEAPLADGDHVVFTPHGADYELSGQISSVASAACEIEVYGCADGRRYWVGSQSIRREIAHEAQWRTQHGRYVEDMRDRS